MENGQWPFIASFPNKHGVFSCTYLSLPEGRIWVRLLVHDMWREVSTATGCEEPYMHIGYEYQLHRATMPRSGEGDLWMNYEGQPKISLQGVAQSPKFGKGISALSTTETSVSWSKPAKIQTCMRFLCLFGALSC